VTNAVRNVGEVNGKRKAETVASWTRPKLCKVYLCFL